MNTNELQEFIKLVQDNTKLKNENSNLRKEVSDLKNQITKSKLNEVFGRCVPLNGIYTDTDSLKTVKEGDAN